MTPWIAGKRWLRAWKASRAITTGYWNRSASAYSCCSAKPRTAPMSSTACAPRDEPVEQRWGVLPWSAAQRSP